MSPVPWHSEIRIARFQPLGLWGRFLICFVLVPSLLALLNIVRGTTYAPALSVSDRVLLFYPTALVAWGVSGLIMATIFKLTNARTFFATVAAIVAGCVLTEMFDYYVISQYFYLMRGRWPWMMVFFYKSGMLKYSIFESMYTPSAIYNYITIITANVVYRVVVPGARYLGDRAIAVAGSANEHHVPVDDVLPSPATVGKIESKTAAFTARIPPHLSGPIVLLEAEEHYLRVVTSRGSALILYRLGDAVAELVGLDGDQVHRSFWIAWPEVVGIEQRGGAYRLTMSSGDQVPVSRSHLGVVKRHISRQHLVIAEAPLAAAAPAQ